MNKFTATETVAKIGFTVKKLCRNAKSPFNKTFHVTNDFISIIRFDKIFAFLNFVEISW